MTMSATLQFVLFSPPILASKNMKQVLIVEDDRSIVELIQINLADLDCNIRVSHTGADAVSIATREILDLVILDLMLPGISGIEICKKIRQQNSLTPILMLTARSEESDKIMGLESGADDYITKPFSINEFVARVKSIFRRGLVLKNVSAYDNTPKLLFDGMEIEPEARKLLINGKKAELSPKEFDLLVLFASHPGRSFTREKILNLVWGYDFEGFEHTVNSHINRLRAKIETDISNPKYILTTWGVGYRFSEEV
jgi:two-component system alkaline phosphatase synthesis response regulator PhoP